MQVGTIFIDGRSVGTIEANLTDVIISSSSDFQNYTPMGRAEDGLGGGGSPATKSQGHQGSHHSPTTTHREHHEHTSRDTPHDSYFDSDIPRKAPAGRTYDGGSDNHSYPQGSKETDDAIVRAAKEAGMDPNAMRGIASIESGINPSSNANRSTQYKGLYQIGHDEWRRTGQGGNIYSAQDNASAMARLVNENSRQFKKHFGRDPTETEVYMMHQQGLGFYTNGAMTNIAGNPYPGMRGPQTHESFEAGWGRELAKRKAAFGKANPAPVANQPTGSPGAGNQALPPITVTPDDL